MLLERIGRHATERPHAPALRDETITLAYASLQGEIENASTFPLGSRVGLLLDNGAHWACLDLAMLDSQRICVPMPGFFSNAQLEHLIRDAGLNTVLTDDPVRIAKLLDVTASDVLEVAGRPVWLFQFKPNWRGRAVTPLPDGTIKITYTSGTTGQPKGVCLSEQDIEKVIVSLCEAVEARGDDRALSLLPLSTLLENIAGLYAPLWVGALAEVPTLASCGFTGTSGLQPASLFDAFQKYAPTTTILVPQLLKGLVDCIGFGMPVPSSLRFAAVGGAPTPSALIERARHLGVPVYQGYGLSEAGSVASLNTAFAERDGSVGKPLPHLQVSIAEDGEVVVSGNIFLGYLGETSPASKDVWRTGDLGYLDKDGFLFLTGRKKTAYATAYGRNVSPEWVESELTSHPLISQAAVFGEGQPFNVAVIVPGRNTVLQDLIAAMKVINGRLPDYAQIGRWIVADQPFSHLNGLANSAGCMQRQAVWKQYQTRIEQHYLSEERHAVL
jgi:long-chain acyl-CoA synthetase